MWEILVFSILVGGLTIISFLFGKARTEKNQLENQLHEGEKIDKIINNNSNISDGDWADWLQERRDKQK